MNHQLNKEIQNTDVMLIPNSAMTTSHCTMLSAICEMFSELQLVCAIKAKCDKRGKRLSYCTRLSFGN